VLLVTARVTVWSSSGRAIKVRALIDQGSEITFMTEQLAQVLKVRRLKMPISISALGGVNIGPCRHSANIRISAYDQTQPMLTTCAAILPSLTSYSPPPVTAPLNFDYLSGISLADSDPFSSDPIDLLIGADLYTELIVSGVRKGDCGQPVAQKTIFGWILSGSTSASGNFRRVTAQICASGQSLDQLLRKFWEIEEIPRQTFLTPDEQQCEDHFRYTHSRDSDGRYVVRLPFKHSPPIDIGESRTSASRILYSMTQRLKDHTQLETEYREFLHEYENLGHMRAVSFFAFSVMQRVYIPHHPVIRDGSLTTRVRVVFNASSRTTNGSSLNDHLLSGPKLQTGLSAVILR